MNYYDQLLNFLNAHRFLVLPGVGTIVVIRSYADFSHHGNMVAPPKFHLEIIKDDMVGFEKQVSRLAAVWSLSEQNVREIFEGFSSELHADLIDSQYALLPGIGYLRKIGTNVQLQTTGEIERKLHYLKTDVPIQKLFRLREREVKIVEKEPKVARYVVLTKSMRWAAASLLLFAIVLVGVGVSPEVKSFLLPVRYSIEDMQYSQDDFNRAPETDGSERNTDVVVSDGEWESEADLSSESEVVEGQVLETPPIKRILTFSSENYEESMDSKECTYIAGSFKSSRRALRMKKILTEEGFVIHESPYKEFTRVGIILPCNQDSSLARLAKIESGYWLLQD